MDWLSKIDPNVLAAIAGALIGFFKHHKTKKQGENVSAIVKHALQLVVLQLLSLPNAEANARELLTTAAYKTLAELGFKRSKAVDLATKAAVELAMVELHERLLERAGLVHAVAELPTATQGALDAFTPKPPELRTVPQLGIQMEQMPPDWHPEPEKK